MPLPRHVQYMIKGTGILSGPVVECQAFFSSPSNLAAPDRRPAYPLGPGSPNLPPPNLQLHYLPARLKEEFQLLEIDTAVPVPLEGGESRAPFDGPAQVRANVFAKGRREGGRERDIACFLMPSPHAHALSHAPTHPPPPPLRTEGPKEAFALILAILLHPRSRGTVTLASADPMVPPLCDPRYLSDPRDLEELVAGIQANRQVLAELRRRYPADAGPEIPEEGTLAEVQRSYAFPDREAALASDQYVREMIRRTAITLYHPVGTCQMGPVGAEGAVVDGHTLLVHGMQGLVVADASVMPTIVSGNTAASCMLIGDRAALFAGRRWHQHLLASGSASKL
jgi:choline dehydrogenase-like flavoprotein